MEFTCNKEIDISNIVVIVESRKETVGSTRSGEKIQHIVQNDFWITQEGILGANFSAAQF
jgi:hypothetical protein